MFQVWAIRDEWLWELFIHPSSALRFQQVVPSQTTKSSAKSLWRESLKIRLCVEFKRCWTSQHFSEETHVKFTIKITTRLFCTQPRQNCSNYALKAIETSWEQKVLLSCMWMSYCDLLRTERYGLQQAKVHKQCTTQSISASCPLSLESFFINEKSSFTFEFCIFMLTSNGSFVLCRSDTKLQGFYRYRSFFRGTIFVQWDYANNLHMNNTSESSFLSGPNASGCFHFTLHSLLTERLVHQIKQIQRNQYKLLKFSSKSALQSCSLWKPSTAESYTPSCS